MGQNRSESAANFRVRKWGEGDAEDEWVPTAGKGRGLPHAAPV